MKYFTFFFFNNYFGPYWIDSRPVSVCFGPNQTDLEPVSAVSDRIRLYRAESENQKKKSLATDAHAAASTAARRVLAYPIWVRQPNRHTRASQMDAYSWVVLILGFQRGYCFSNHYDCSINPNLVYIACPYLDCISWFFIRNRCFRKLEFFKFLNFH